MNLVRLGSDRGGWTVDLDSIPHRSVVIDAGIGRDDSFARELLSRKAVTVVALDPSPDARDHYEKNPVPVGMVFLPFALTKDGEDVEFFVGDGRSDSAKSAGMPGMTGRGYTAKGISMPMLGRNDVSLVKLDIEGMEFDVLERCINVARQVAVEFHTVQLPHRIPDMERLIERFNMEMYDVIHRTERNEVTFLKR